MRDDRDQQIRRFVSQMIVLDEAQKTQLSRQELREIVLELGYDSEDLERLERTARAHALRASNFAKVDQFDLAAKEYAMALALEPTDISLQIDYATVLFERHKRTADPEDYALAWKLATQCVQQDPDFQPAYQLMQRMSASKEHALQVAQTQPKSRKSDNLFWALVTLGFFGILSTIALVSVVVFVSEPVPLPAAPVAEKSTPAPLKKPAPSEPRRVVTPPIKSKADDGLKQVPMKIVLPDDVHLDVDVALSELRVYSSGGAAYNVRLQIRNTEKEQSFSELSGHIVLYGANNRRLGVLDQPKVWDGSGIAKPFRPGDSISRKYLKMFEEEQPTRAEFVITRSVKTLAPRTHEKVDLAWDVDSPYQDKLTLYERSVKISRKYPFSKTNKNEHYFTALMAMQLQGDTPINSLKLRLEIFDKAGELLVDDSFWPYASVDADVRPGGVYPFSTIKSFKGTFDSYRITVTDIK